MRDPKGQWPFYDDDEIAAVTAVLAAGRGNYWSGELGRRFEREFARVMGCRYGVAVANGTLALELALRALGIGPGDEVIVPCRTFIASASAVVRCGATPVVVDVDRDSQNLTPATIEAALTPATRAVVAVHLAGWPCDMEAIMDLARRHRLKVVEDCAQAHGATVNGRPVGSFGDAGAFSFCQDKIISTGGEGGMVVTNDETVWQAVWSDKDHGKRTAALENSGPGLFYTYLHDRFGTNARMTEMQAAIGLAQLAKLPGWLARRRRNAGILRRHLQGLAALRLPQPPAGVEHAYYKFYAFVRREHLRPEWSRDRILEELREVGVVCGTGSCPEIDGEAAFRHAGLPAPATHPVARELGETSLMFQVHPTLEPAAMEETGRLVARVVAAATAGGGRG